MSTLQTKTVRLGDSATLANNFELSVPPVPDGTLTLQRQDGTDILTVNAAGNVLFPGGLESGTYSPTIVGGTSEGSGVYTNQVGNWQRIGKLVFVRGRVTWTSHTGTGEERITLPFTMQGFTVVNVWVNNVALAVNSYAAALVANGTNYFVMYNQIVGGGGASAMTVDAGGGDLFFSGIFEML